MKTLHLPDPLLKRPVTGMGLIATAIGLPAGMLATVLLLSAVGADNAGLAMLTFLSMVVTLLAGLLGAGAMAFRGERSPWVMLVLGLAVLPMMFIVVELIFSRD